MSANVKQSVVQNVMSRIVGMMQSHKFKPGDRLPSERQLADAFGVSRSSVRSATQILAFNRFLTIKPGSGIYFNEIPSHAEMVMEQLDKPDMKNANRDFIMQNECRLIVEPSVGRLAALYATPEKLEEMHGVIERMRQYVQSDSFGGYAVEDMYFHRLCAEATGNPYLISAANHYCLDVNYMLAFSNTPNLEEESFEQHEAIYAAILNRDPDLAEQLMREHVRFALRKNKGYIFAENADIRKGVLR